MSEIKKGDLVYIPIIGGGHYKVLHTFERINNGRSIVIKNDEDVLCTFAFKDYFIVNAHNYKIMIDSFGISPKPPIKSKALYDENDLVYVPELGTGIFDVCCIIGNICYVSYYCTQERDDVLFLVNAYNSHKANRNSRLALNRLFKKEFSPTIYDGKESANERMKFNL